MAVTIALASDIPRLPVTTQPGTPDLRSPNPWEVAAGPFETDTISENRRKSHGPATAVSPTGGRREADGRPTAGLRRGPRRGYGGGDGGRGGVATLRGRPSRGGGLTAGREIAGHQPVMWRARKASEGGSSAWKNGPVWQPRANRTTAPGGSALASARTPGRNGSPSPVATRTATPCSELACVTASAEANALAEAYAPGFTALACA